MKYFILVLAICLWSCGNSKQETSYVIIYEFEEPESISSNTKQNTVSVIHKRLDVLATKYEVQLNSKQQIEVKLETEYPLNAINRVITNPGKLEFWECMKSEDLSLFYESLFDALELEIDNYTDPQEIIGFPVMGGLVSVDVDYIDVVIDILQRENIVVMLPEEGKKSKFLLGKNHNDFIDLFLVKKTSSGNAFVNESHIIDARQNYDAIGRPSVTMKMNELGSNRWERMTRNAYENRSQIAVTLNDSVYSAPTVSMGPIYGGLTEVTGDFTAIEAQHLALILNSGHRIPKIKYVSSTVKDNQK